MATMDGSNADKVLESEARSGAEAPVSKGNLEGGNSLPKSASNLPYNVHYYRASFPPTFPFGGGGVSMRKQRGRLIGGTAQMQIPSQSPYL